MSGEGIDGMTGEGIDGEVLRWRICWDGKGTIQEMRDSGGGGGGGGCLNARISFYKYNVLRIKAVIPVNN